MIILHRAQALQGQSTRGHMAELEHHGLLDICLGHQQHQSLCRIIGTEYWKTSDFNRVLLRFQSADLGPVLALIGHIIHGAWSGTCHRFFTP